MCMYVFVFVCALVLVPKVYSNSSRVHICMQQQALEDCAGSILWQIHAAQLFVPAYCTSSQ